MLMGSLLDVHRECRNFLNGRELRLLTNMTGICSNSDNRTHGFKRLADGGKPAGLVIMSTWSRPEMIRTTRSRLAGVSN
jgi:hypothetical protein